MSARDYMEKDFYQVLGVPKAATPAEIKKAYRGLARKLHPDKNPGDAAAEKRFKEVSEAYDVLSDDSRRKEYDEARALFGGGGFRPGRPGAPGPAGSSFDLGDLLGGGRTSGGFGDLFGNLFGSGGRPGPQRGTDIVAEVTVSFAGALHGLEASVRVPGAAGCDVCQGSGAAPGTAPRRCPSCGGSGLVTRNQGGFALSEPCRDCRGTGSIVDTPCPACGGTGRRERMQKIRIPAGVRDGQRLRVRGRGGPAGARGGHPGDLEVTVHVTGHAVFGRDGSALTLTLPVTFPEAALGATVTIPTFDGPVTLKIPAGTTSGRRLRVKDRGFPHAGGRGPLLVTIEVAVPAKLSRQAKASLESFAAEVHEDPRAHLTALLAETV